MFAGFSHVETRNRFSFEWAWRGDDQVTAHDSVASTEHPHNAKRKQSGKNWGHGVLNYPCYIARCPRRSRKSSTHHWPWGLGSYTLKPKSQILQSLGYSNINPHIHSVACSVCRRLRRANDFRSRLLQAFPWISWFYLRP